FDQPRHLRLREYGQCNADGCDCGIEVTDTAGFDALIEIVSDDRKQGRKVLAADVFGFAVNFEQSDGDEADEFGREGCRVDEDVQETGNKHFRRRIPGVVFERAQTRGEGSKAGDQRGPEEILFALEVAE